jgi:hypothetical protein
VSARAQTATTLCSSRLTARTRPFSSTSPSRTSSACARSRTCPCRPHPRGRQARLPHRQPADRVAAPELAKGQRRHRGGGCGCGLWRGLRRGAVREPHVRGDDAHGGERAAHQEGALPVASCCASCAVSLLFKVINVFGYNNAINATLRTHTPSKTPTPSSVNLRIRRAEPT